MLGLADSASIGVLSRESVDIIATSFFYVNSECLVASPGIIELTLCHGISFLDLSAKMADFTTMAAADV